MATSTAPTTASGKLLQARKPAASSKTRPQAPVVVAHECPSALRAHVVEVGAGRDVVACLAAFARQRRRGVLVLGATGHVADAVLRAPAVVLRGRLEILALAGCFFPASEEAAAAAAVFLAGPHGRVVGGGVAAGGLVAAGPVVVMVATFVAAAFDRLPLLKGEESALKAESCGEAQSGSQRPPPQQPCGWAHWRKLSSKS